MAYRGKYRVKNPEKYEGDHTRVEYRSLWERQVFKLTFPFYKYINGRMEKKITR